MTINPLKKYNYHHTVSDKVNYLTCKKITICEDRIKDSPIKLDRYHVCDEVDVKEVYKR